LVNYDQTCKFPNVTRRLGFSTYQLLCPSQLFSHSPEQIAQPLMWRIKFIRLENQWTYILFCIERRLQR